MKKITVILTTLAIFTAQISNSQQAFSLNDHFNKITADSQANKESARIYNVDNGTSNFEFMGETYEAMPEEIHVPTNGFEFLGES